MNVNQVRLGTALAIGTVGLVATAASAGAGAAAGGILGGAKRAVFGRGDSAEKAAHHSHFARNMGLLTAAAPAAATAGAIYGADKGILASAKRVGSAAESAAAMFTKLRPPI